MGPERRGEEREKANFRVFSFSVAKKIFLCFFFLLFSAGSTRRVPIAGEEQIPCGEKRRDLTAATIVKLFLLACSPENLGNRKNVMAALYNFQREARAQPFF